MGFITSLIGLDAASGSKKAHIDIFIYLIDLKFPKVKNFYLVTGHILNFPDSSRYWFYAFNGVYIEFCVCNRPMRVFLFYPLSRSDSVWFQVVVLRPPKCIVCVCVCTFMCIICACPFISYICFLPPPLSALFNFSTFFQLIS